MSLARGHHDFSPRALPAFALLALGVGGFAVGTGEFVIMGLLPEVARGIGMSIPAAGQHATLRSERYLNGMQNTYHELMGEFTGSSEQNVQSWAWQGLEEMQH